jgi:predicted amidohydrolase YtcJ
MIIKNGKVEFLGPKATDGDAKAKEMKCRIIDLDGKAVLPGLHDVHMHPMEVGSSVAGTCMVPKNTKPNDAKMFVNFEAGCFLNQTGTDWILGHGHSIWAMLDYIKYPGPGGLLDPKKWLDLYVSDKPVVIMEETSHSVWVNTEALKRAGLLGKNPQAPIGGKVMLNADNEANGILIENAGNWIMDMAFNQVLYPKLIPLADEGLVAGLDELAKNGITSFVDARCYWQRENHKSYERVEFGNKMTARAVLAMWAYPAATNDDAQIEALANFYNNPMDGMVKRTQIKVYEDGLFGVRTARVLKPYLLPTPDYGIGDFGLNYFTQQRLGEYINALQIGLGQDGTEGYDFMVHVVGDAATREVLDAVRDNPHPIEGASRHRCTHVELVDESDRPRFKALNVIADAQVAGDFALSGSPAHKDMVKMVGPRGEDSIPIKSLKAQGARVTLSSDWDVSPLSPFLGMSHAINRGPQSVSLKVLLL